MASKPHYKIKQVSDSSHEYLEAVVHPFHLIKAPQAVFQNLTEPGKSHLEKDLSIYNCSVTLYG